MPDDDKKKKSRVLGWGMAESTRRKIKDRKNTIDSQLDEIMGVKPKKKKKDSK